ncbi:hypothetical protein ES703_105473 [subsurface metagenome]
MDNSGSNLRFYIITDNGKPSFSKALLPILLSTDKNWNTVDKATASGQHLLNIPLGCLFTTNRQKVNHHIGLGFLKNFNYVGCWTWRLLNNLRQILAQTIMGHTPLNLNPCSRHLTEFKCIIRLSKNCLRQVLAHFVLININGSYEIDIAYMVSPQINMHKPGHKFSLFRLPIVINTLNQ